MAIKNNGSTCWASTKQGAAHSGLSALVDGGNRILVPSLRAQGIAQLDGLMLTHDDTDHTGGALSVMQTIPIGWLSSSLVKRGWSLNASRKTAMLVCAVAVVPIVFASRTPNLYVAVALVSLAAAAHQGWSANLYTTTSDIFPKQAVASVTGIGGALGGLGGVLFSGVLPGYIVTYFGYTPVFLMMGCFHLTALLVVQWLLGRMQPNVPWRRAENLSPW